MNKLFTKIATLSVGLLMAIGVGVGIGANKGASPAHAADELVYILDGTKTDGTNGYAEASNISQNDVSWSVMGNTTMSPWRIGGKKISNQDRAIYSTISLDDNINKIEVESGSSTLDSVNSLTISVHSSASGASGGTTDIVASQTTSAESNITSKTVTFAKADATSWAGCYFRIVYNVSKSANSYAYVELKSIKFYKAQAADTVSVIYNSNAGGDTVTGLPSNDTVSKNTIGHVLSDATPSRAGYKFVGWSLSTSGSTTTTIDVGTTDVNVYAIWTAKSSRAISVSNVTNNSLQLTKGDEFELSIVIENESTPEGYTVSVTTGSAVSASGATLTATAVGNATVTISKPEGTEYVYTSCVISVSVQGPSLPSAGYFTITKDNFSTGSYGTGSGTSSVFNTNDQDSGAEVSWSFAATYQNNGGIQMQKTNGKIYNTTPLNSIKKITYSEKTNLPTIYYGTTENPSDRTTLNAGDTYFSVVAVGAFCVIDDIRVDYEPPKTLDHITAALADANKKYRVGDSVPASDFTVSAYYENEEDPTTVSSNITLCLTENGTYTDSVTLAALQTYPSNQNVYIKYGGKTTSVAISTLSNAIGSYEVRGTATAKTGGSWDISSLVLKAYYCDGDEITSFDSSDYTLEVTTAVPSTEDDNVTIAVVVKKNSVAVSETVTVTAHGEVADADAGSEEKPYTVSQAIAAAISQGATASSDASYVRGYVYFKASNNQIFLTGDLSEIDVAKTPSTEEKNARLCIYKSGGITDVTSVAVGDQVVVSGNLQYYNSNQPEFNNGVIESYVSETMTVNKTIASESLVVNTEFSYSGVVSIDYTHKTDVADANSLVTFSGYDMSTVGEQTVTISYTDAKLGKSNSTTYTLNVTYAPVSSVVIDGPSSVNMTQIDDHEFTATLNDNVDPGSTITWNVTDSVGSLVANSEASFNGNTLEVITEEEGTLLVTASCGGITSAPVTVYVTGNPVVQLDNSDLYGFIGQEDNSIKSSINGGSAPYSYKWTLPANNGVASIDDDVDDEDEVLIDFIGRGEVTITLTVTDSNNKKGTATADIHVTETLKTIIPSTTTEYNETYVASEQGYTKGDLIESFSGTNFDIAFNKASASTAPTYYDNKAPYGVRVYAKGEMIVSSTHTIEKIELTCSASDSNEFSVDVGELDGNTWTGSATSVTFTTSGTKGNIGVSSVKVYWSVTAEGDPINNTNYFAQKAAIEFAEELTSKLNSVCNAQGATDTAALAAKWAEIKAVYDSKVASLDEDLDTFKLLIRCATPSDAANADKLQKALASYNYVYAKYHAVLDEEGVGGDFLADTGKAAVQQTVVVSPLVLIGKSTDSMAIIIAISMVSLLSLGGYFCLRKRKEQ